MAKRKKVEEEEAPKESPAETYARQRRLACFKQEEGEQFIALLNRAGFRLTKVGSTELAMYRASEGRFVVDPK